MCFNIRILGNRRTLAYPIRSQKIENPGYLAIVTHALRKHLTDDEVRKVLHGYRRSPWSETALQHDIDKLNSPEFNVKKDEHYWKAIAHTKKLFNPEHKMRPVHFADLRHYPWELSTNIGAPFATSKYWQQYVKEKFRYFKDGTPFSNERYQRMFDLSYMERNLFFEAHGTTLEPEMVDDRMSKRNLYNEMFFINRKNIHDIKDGKITNQHGHDMKYWHTAFARQHLVEAEDPDKVRLVFGAPSTLLMAEQMFIWPYQAQLLARGSKSPMLWGFETLQGGWNRLYAQAYHDIPAFGSVLTLDWSGFDRRARHTVIRDIHQHILREAFDFDKGYWPTHAAPETYANPQRIENLFNWMCDAILSTPLILPNGDVLEFQHSGIYSGYFQTQILDSIYNCIMICTVLSKLGFDLERIWLKIQGDDSLVLLLHSWIALSSSFLPLFTHHARQYFGAEVSEKKSAFLPSLEGAEVLHYRNHGTMPERDELQLLAMLAHPERSTSESSLMARSIGVAYADAGRHPRVLLICEDIYNYLKDLGFSPDAKGLPGGMRRRSRYIPGDNIVIDLSRFPTYLDTVKHLLDPARELLTEKHWPRKHFIGVPGFPIA